MDNIFPQVKARLLVKVKHVIKKKLPESNNFYPSMKADTDQ